MTLVHKWASEFLESRKNTRDFTGEKQEIAYEAYLHGASHVVKSLSRGIREMADDDVLRTDEKQLLLVVVDIIESTTRVQM
jgi:hypothetical protein